MEPAGRAFAARLGALSPERQELFHRLIEERGLPRRELPILPRPPGRDRVPASQAQQRLWLQHRLQPGNPAYILPVAADLEGDLDVEALAVAIGRVADRHEALRTRFELDAAGPVQVIEPAAPYRLAIEDLAAAGEAAGEAAVAERTVAALRRPFDAAAGPPWRATVLRRGPRSHRLLIALDHLVADEWSVGLLVAEVAEIYRARGSGRPPRLPALAVQYPDFSEWQRGWLGPDTIAAQVEHCRRRLEPLPPRPRLGFGDGGVGGVGGDGGGGEPGREPAGAAHSFALDPGLTRDLGGLARSRGATLFVVLLAAFESLIAAHAGQEELAVGTDLAGRDRPELESLIGFFVNQWVLRCDLRRDPPFAEHLARVREGVLDALAYQSLPYQHLVEALRPARSGPAGTALFRAKFVLQERPAEPGDLGGLGWQPVAVEPGGSKFDLLLNMQVAEGRLRGAFEYSRALFDAASIRLLGGQFERILRRIVDEPGVRHRELAAEASSAAERWREDERETLRRRQARKLAGARRQPGDPGGAAGG